MSYVRYSSGILFYLVVVISCIIITGWWDGEWNVFRMGTGTANGDRGTGGTGWDTNVMKDLYEHITASQHNHTQHNKHPNLVRPSVPSIKRKRERRDEHGLKLLVYTDLSFVYEIPPFLKTNSIIIILETIFYLSFGTLAKTNFLTNMKRFKTILELKPFSIYHEYR